MAKPKVRIPKNLKSFGGGESLLKEGTVNWFKYEIRNMTAEFNRRFRETAERGEIPEQFNKLREEFIREGARPNPLSKDAIGLGFSVKGKGKAGLVRQWSNLQRALKIDIWSPTAEEYRTERELNAWRKFNDNQVLSWSYDKWKAMVEIFGNMDSTILHGFGYEDKSTHNASQTADDGKQKKTIEIEENFDPEGKVSNSSLVSVFSKAYDNDIDLLSVMNRVYNRKVQGRTQRTALNDLYKEIQDIINERKEESEDD